MWNTHHSPCVSRHFKDPQVVSRCDFAKPTSRNWRKSNRKFRSCFKGPEISEIFGKKRISNPRDPITERQMMIGVYNHLLIKVFSLHFHSQKVFGSLGQVGFFLTVANRCSRTPTRRGVRPRSSVVPKRSNPASATQLRIDSWKQQKRRPWNWCVPSDTWCFYGSQ